MTHFSTSQFVSKRSESRKLGRNLNAPVRSSILHSTEKLYLIQAAICTWLQTLNPVWASSEVWKFQQGLQYGWAPKARRQVKQTQHRKLNTVRFHLHLRQVRGDRKWFLRQRQEGRRRTEHCLRSLEFPSCKMTRLWDTATLMVTRCKFFMCCCMSENDQTSKHCMYFVTALKKNYSEGAEKFIQLAGHLSGKHKALGSIQNTVKNA